jgi:hypothetical protein
VEADDADDLPFGSDGGLEAAVPGKLLFGLGDEAFGRVEVLIGRPGQPAREVLPVRLDQRVELSRVGGFQGMDPDGGKFRRYQRPEPPRALSMNGPSSSATERAASSADSPGVVT